MGVEERREPCPSLDGVILIGVILDPRADRGYLWVRKAMRLLIWLVVSVWPKVVGMTLVG